MPRITAVVATLNEERHIATCIAGLLNQVGVELEEILVVDGGSTDGTIEILERLPEFGKKVFLLRNPDRFQVYAWNIGAAAARGDYLALFSAHTEYAPDYLFECVMAAKRSGAANVGGVQVPITDGGIAGPVIAWAMSSRFGVGGASFRYTQEECFVDSVFGGFYDLALLRRLGGFDVRIPFDEDADLNYRLAKAGHRILLSPKIKLHYHVRPSLRALSRQMFRYGFWRRATQLKHPRHVPRRVVVPSVFLLMAALSLTMLAAGQPGGLIVPLAYAAFCGLATLEAARRLRSAGALLAPVVLFVMHVSYGAGYLFGCMQHSRNAFVESH